MLVLVLIFPVLLLAFQFVFVKEFQNRAGYGLTQGFFMSMVTGAVAFTVLFIIKGFSLHLFYQNVVFAFLVGLGIVIVKSMLVKAVSMGMVAISTVFYVSGGVLIPFIYGILFLGEKLSVFKIIGITLVCISFLLVVKSNSENSSDKKVSLKFFIVCFIIFLTNGFLTIIIKTNQIITPKEHTIDFIAIYSLFIFILSVLGLITCKFRNTKNEFSGLFKMKNASSANKVSICNTSANIFSLSLAKKLPASVQFPVMNIGVMLVTTLLSIFIYKEIPNKKTILSLFIAVLAVTFLVI